MRADACEPPGARVDPTHHVACAQTCRILMVYGFRSAACMVCVRPRAPTRTALATRTVPKIHRISADCHCPSPMAARHTRPTSPAHARRPADMPTKKVRKNRYMRRMQSRHGRLSWGMPFPARLRRSHREHACCVHLLAATGARTVSRPRSAEEAALLADGRCRCRWRCRVLQEEGEKGAW